MKKQVLAMVLLAAGFVVGCKEEPKKTPANPTPPAAPGANGTNGSATRPSMPATMPSGVRGSATTNPAWPALSTTRPSVITPSTRSGSILPPIGSSPSTRPTEEFNK